MNSFQQNSTCTTMRWPGILKVSGDPELVFIKNQSQWDFDPDLHQVRQLSNMPGPEPGEPFSEHLLIDSNGNMYALAASAGSRDAAPQALDKTIPLKDLLGLIKAHAALSNYCCVAKLNAATIPDAFQLMQWLSENGTL